MERPRVEDPTIKLPALLLMGEKDYVIKFPGMEEYVRGEMQTNFIPNLELKFLPEGSHFVHEQNPEEVNQIILDFLNKNI